MELDEVKRQVSLALEKFIEVDLYLLQHNLSERCIASRFAYHLQNLCCDYSVDVEYNRVGQPPKRLNLPEECANFKNKEGESLAVPDLIVHQRGSDGPNILVLEFKKTTNAAGFDCDRKRLHAFRSQLKYRFGALVECETREQQQPGIRVVEWVHD